MLNVPVKRLPAARMPSVALAVILAHWLPPMPLFCPLVQSPLLSELLPLPHIVELVFEVVKQLRLPSMSPPGIDWPAAAVNDPVNVSPPIVALHV